MLIELYHIIYFFRKYSSIDKSVRNHRQTQKQYSFDALILIIVFAENYLLFLANGILLFNNLLLIWLVRNFFKSSFLIEAIDDNIAKWKSYLFDNMSIDFEKKLLFQSNKKKHISHIWVHYLFSKKFNFATSKMLGSKESINQAGVVTWVNPLEKPDNRFFYPPLQPYTYQPR